MPVSYSLGLSTEIVVYDLLGRRRRHAQNDRGAVQ